MRTFLLLSPLLLGMVVADPEKLLPPKVVTTQEPELSLEGVWQVQGENYDGAVTIRRTGGSWFFHYASGRVFADGKVASSTTVGVGMLHGEHLSVAWLQGERTVGLTVYKLKGKVLEGRWVAIPGGNPSVEKLRFLTALPKEE